MTYVLPAALALAVAAGFTLSSAEAKHPPAEPPPPEVTVAAVELRSLPEQEERPGRVVATEVVELRPEVSGRIVQVGFEAGQLVKQGELLFRIDPEPYAAVVAAAEAELSRAQAIAETAAREAGRATALIERAAISREEAELRHSRAEQAKAEVKAAEAALESARIALKHTEVLAPISGRVSRAYVTEGNLVSGNPSGATLLTSIVAVGQVHVHVNVDEATVHRFRKAFAAGWLPTELGRVPVELRLDQSGQFTHRGYVESLDNRIDPDTGSMIVRLIFNDPLDELIPGSFVRVRLPLSGPEPRLVINERAVGTDQSQKFVLVVDETQTIEYRPVELGRSLGSERIIRTGLNPGERIVVNGLHRVRPGMAVNPQSSSEPTTVAAR